MARRKSEDSKTAAILNFSKEHPGEGPSAIAAALKEQGIEVSAQYVSTIKSKFGVPGPRKRRGKGGRKAKAPTAAAAAPARGRPSRARSSQDEVGFESLVKAKEFVESQGGMDRAKRVLEAYAKLQ